MLFGFYLSWRATRLHRLHHRVDTARAALEAALERRLAAASALAAADGTDATRALPGAAEAARGARDRQRELAESALSRTLRAALESPGPAERSNMLRPHLIEVEAAAKGVHMARTFYNGAVSDTRRARRSRLVRTFRLAGTAPLPDFFEIDDQPPRIPLLPVGPDTP
ncbi:MULTISPECIES: hypothetical protein [Nocardiopsis]|uniref:LemA family protein n=4 Tax=Nocardiopsis TaxID=2013 RepID=D7AZH4_NOCDD|nr:hypothetical protein [Nocardiopsis dassonvillei]ADH66266.1 conserved hypothetical protein [Nocardiopsis dassonvillei subsp. dassonvillei DSM 43111]APC34590.1 hypothetical protein A9R04_07750 [Nocardiopsis dassonvillei]VEI92288.1 Uncharacterised protein [Nocardiopsis dassonvillei]